MVLHKHVNGIRVELSAEEEAQVRAEWAANDLIREKEQELQDLLEQMAPVEERIEAIEQYLFGKGKPGDPELAMIKKSLNLSPKIKAKKLEIKNG